MIERTFVAVKHDGIQRGLVGEIIKRFEQRGLKLAAIKMVQVDKDFAEKHYPLTEEWIKNTAAVTRKAYEKRGIKLKESDREICERINKWLKDYLTEGPVVAMVWEGYHAIEMCRKIVGTAESRSAPPGTIRGDYSVDSYELADQKKRPVRNLVHASGNAQEAEHEITLWFRPEEIHDYTRKDWEVMH